MPWVVIEDERGQRWGVNRDGVHLLLQAALRADRIKERSQITSFDDGMMLPTTYLFETDWAGLDDEIAQETDRFYQDATIRLARDPGEMRANLLGMIGRGRADFNTVEDMRRRANRQSIESINTWVPFWEDAMSVTQFLRDHTATILVVGGGVMGGPAGTAFLGLGSAIRGTATYQDTGNVGSALINAAGTFVVGRVGIVGSGPTVARGVAAQMLFIGSGVQGVAQGAQALIEGKNIKVALEQAAISAGFSIFGGAVGGRLQGMSNTVKVTVGGIIDTAGNQLTAAVPPTPVQYALSRPILKRGKIDYAGLPSDPAQDEIYLSQNCLRRL